MHRHEVQRTHDLQIRSEFGRVVEPLTQFTLAVAFQHQGGCQYQLQKDCIFIVNRISTRELRLAESAADRGANEAVEHADMFSHLRHVDLWVHVANLFFIYHTQSNGFILINEP